jgi:hypothetical protein
MRTTQLLPLSLIFAALLTNTSSAQAGETKRLDTGNQSTTEGRGPGNDDALTIAGDLDLSVPLQNAAAFGDTAIGFGFAGRVGWRLRAGSAFVLPEVSAGLQAFPNDSNFMLLRGMAGARLGVRGKIQPQLLAHVGYGGSSSGYSGLAYDVGGALDVHQRKVTFGVHATYNGLLDDAATLSWFNIGPNISFEI